MARFDLVLIDLKATGTLDVDTTFDVPISNHSKFFRWFLQKAGSKGSKKVTIITYPLKLEVTFETTVFFSGLKVVVPTDEHNISPVCLCV